jgi:hypothetical protein
LSDEFDTAFVSPLDQLPYLVINLLTSGLKSLCGKIGGGKMQDNFQLISNYILRALALRALANVKYLCCKRHPRLLFLHVFFPFHSLNAQLGGPKAVTNSDLLTAVEFCNMLYSICIASVTLFIALAFSCARTDAPPSAP